MNLSDAKCVVLPGRCPAEASNKLVGLHKGCYRFWKNIYLEVYGDSNHLESLDPDNFLTQDGIIGLTINDGDFIGIVFYSFHHLDDDPIYEAKYLSCFSSEGRRAIQSSPDRGLMTIEYLTVHPEYRRSCTGGIAISEVLIGLAIRIFQSSHAHIMVGTPRTDVKVDKILKDFSFEVMGTLQKSNYPCSMMKLRREDVQEHPSSAVNSQVWQYYNERNDYT